jgi:hypothetical protein
VRHWVDTEYTESLIRALLKIAYDNTAHHDVVAQAQIAKAGTVAGDCRNGRIVSQTV